MTNRTVFEDIHVMYYKFNFPNPATPRLLDNKLMRDRLDFLLEELNETDQAFVEDDLPEVIDGLIDLMVVAAGTLHLMGVDSQRHWDEVQRANMDKKPGIKEGRDMQYDLYKPVGWVPPQHRLLLGMDE